VLIAREDGVSNKKEMHMSMTERRANERAAVRNGIIRGRLFRDLVASCLVGVENETDVVKKQHLLNLVTRWIKDGKC